MVTLSNPAAAPPPARHSVWITAGLDSQTQSDNTQNLQHCSHCDNTAGVRQEVLLFMSQVEETLRRIREAVTK